LATLLGVPFINIDAASMSDYHTASAQLLGSGRGIVGSHEPGRLEQAAKHHTGAVIEVSDLDHAAPSVRSQLADLFLQVLGSGEIQTATGAMVSCANLIIAFTMNLPAGSDERAHRSIGFGDAPSHREVSQRVIAEIKTMLSAAFLSRVGSPILFEPLAEDSLAEIARRAVEESVASALSRMGMAFSEIIVNQDVGNAVLAAVEVNLTSFGVRALVEKARSLSADAVLALKHRKANAALGRVEVSVTGAGTLALGVRTGGK
jgi:ATP-dependent Clp protease ATP-binding subunit ClpA